MDTCVCPAGPGCPDLFPGYITQNIVNSLLYGYRTRLDLPAVITCPFEPEEDEVTVAHFKICAKIIIP